MGYETILCDAADGVTTITLHRPEKYNAFNEQMIAETMDAVKAAARDETIRAIVLTGAGKAFSSGQDLHEMQAVVQTGHQNGNHQTIGEHLRRGYNVLVTLLRTTEKPIIAAINGVAVGAGSSIALACDLRICSEQGAFVFAAFVNIGLIPDAGATFLLPRLVGMSRAFELAILANSQSRIDAHKALEFGLVTSVVPADKLMEEASALAHKLAQMPTRAIGLTKRALNRAWSNTLSESLELEAQLQSVAGSTHDFAEGVTAFIEKREPKFQGK
jgi:2-(1,2-epoxy-1,2-dihydrophenyl)acetyl-CoA isomerase